MMEFLALKLRSTGTQSNGTSDMVHSFSRLQQKLSQTKMLGMPFSMNVLKLLWALKIIVACGCLLSISWEDSCQTVTTISGLSLLPTDLSVVWWIWLYLLFEKPKNEFTLMWNKFLLKVVRLILYQHDFNLCCHGLVEQ